MPNPIRIATGAFAFREWKGKFYPRDLPEKEAIPFYVQTFSAVELNNTFYQLPSFAVIQGQVAQTPANFKFVVKASRLITHIKRLANCDEPLQRFLSLLPAFGNRLGALLFQLPPHFKLDLERLESFLKLLPKGKRIAFEFRHPTWFVPAAFNLLKKFQVALVYNDTDIDMPFVSTADWGYLRLRRLKYSNGDLKSWAQKIKRQKWKEVWVIFKHEEKATAPKLAQRFKAFL